MRVDAAVTVGGKQFHDPAAATENARSSSDNLLVAGTTSAGELDDLRRAAWTPLKRLVEVGRTLLVPDHVDT